MESTAAALDEYHKAQRAGQKNYRECIAKGVYPYLQVLDEILQHTAVETTQPLGLVDIPAERIVGTKTAGRKTAFSRSFMPLLEEKSEFARKWVHLCEAQMTEGIREPIRAFEFMNCFYVQEGNKRVSVLKHFGAASVAGYVTRLVPPRTGTKENRIYYEFLDFYRDTAINCLWFTEEGRFARLVAAAGKVPGETWTPEERAALVSAYRRFRDAFDAAGGSRLPITASDALLTYMEVYGYGAVAEKSKEAMQADLAAIWKEVLVLAEDDALEVSMGPAANASRPLLNKLFGTTPEHLRVAFIHEKTPGTSAWTYAHEMGRDELDEAFGARVSTVSYDGVVPGVDDDAALERAIEQGAQVVFTTTPRLMAAGLKAAVSHPEVKILNCSLNMIHPDIRTYYGRIHEAKFLVGAIAGALSDDNRIGYVATYPTYGMVAGINAFALGAKMVNPRAEVYLEWTAVKNRDIDAAFAAAGVDVISNLDMRAPEHNSPQFGLYRMENGHPHNYAMPFWQWGRFYTRIVGSIFDGTWREVGAGNRAINYWWGMAAGVVDVVCSHTLPPDTMRLVTLLRQAITQQEFEPFSGVLRGQDGVLHGRENARMTPEEIITMDWLADNVVGHIPPFDELIDEAKPLVLLQGVSRESV